MNNAADSNNAVAATLFDRFASAFATFDAVNVASLFAVPSVALRTDGSLVALSTREDLLQYYQAALDTYRRSGCRSCRWLDLEVAPIGTQAVMATVSWELLREDASIARRWRQSYCVSTHEEVPRIFATAMHTA